MNIKPIDKKQVPQFAALCVVTAGVFGYVVVHFVMPGTASAGTRPAATPARSAAPVPAAVAPMSAAAGQASAAGQGAAGAAAATASTDIPDAPPPSPTMHDPFAVGYADPTAAASAAALTPVKAPALPKLPAPGKKIAGLEPFPLPVGPSAPALPGSLSPFPLHPGAPMAGGMPGLPAAPAAPALPAAPAAPSWTVTGVLMGASGKVAILRSGEARRIVHAGDFVDGTYRVTGVTRTSVVLRHGATVYQLPLGGAKAEPVKVRPVPAMFPFVPMPRSAAAIDGTLIPMYHLAPVHSPLAHLKHQGQELGLVAEAPSVPKPARRAATARTATAKRVSPAKVAGAISLGLRLLDGSVLAENRKEQ